MTDPEVSVITDELNDNSVEASATEEVAIDAANDTANDAANDTANHAAIEVPAVIAPDRADAPVSEITERFLRAVVAQIPLERIEELHLFSPLRQSGVETGIAVVAARVPVVAPLVEMAPEFELEDDAIEPVELSTMDGAELVEVDSEGELDVDAVVNDVDTDVVADDVEEVAVEDVVSDTLADEDGAIDVAAQSDIVPAESIPDAVITPILRHTVYTARYRLVQKGPERGKWESDVVAEADAPLITVEMVVRGVQRRAGEESEILRYSAAQIAKALRMPWPIAPVADASVA